MSCQAPPGEKIAISPLVGGVLWKEIAGLIERAGRAKIYASFYGYTGQEAFILLLYIENGLVHGICYDSGKEVYNGEISIQKIQTVLSGEASGLLELIDGSKHPPPKEMRLARPRKLEDLVKHEQTVKQKPKQKPSLASMLEKMDGLQVGMLISEVILHSRLITSAKTVEEAIRRARHESRRDRAGLYRVAVFLEDGSIYNIFIKEGRIRRVILLAPSGIEGRVLRRDENIRQILAEAPVKGASVYKVNCPECEKVILTG